MQCRVVYWAAGSLSLLMATGCGLLLDLSQASDERDGRDGRDAGTSDAADASHRDGGRDAGGDAAFDGGDSGVPWPIPPCLLGEGGFAVPQRLPINADDADDDDPTIYSSGRTQELLFGSTRTGAGADNENLWRSIRAWSDATGSWGDWGEPQPVRELNTDDGGETTPALHSDGRILYLGRLLSGSYDLYVARRASADPASTWEAKAIEELNTASSENGGAATEDGEMLFFSSNRESSWNIYVATRSASGVWVDPTAVDEINSEQGDFTPQPLAGGRVVLFRSYRNDGNSDLYVARREATDEPFQEPEPLPEPVNTDAPEEDPWLTPEGELYFSRREPGSGLFDIFVTRCAD